MKISGQSLHNKLVPFRKKAAKIAGKAGRAIVGWLYKVSPIIVTTIWAAAIIIGGIFILRSLLNETALINYKQEHYFTFPENVVTYMDFGEKEVAPYNMGNFLYQQGKYEDAITWFYTALTEVNENTEEGRDCSIRINLALAILHNYNWDNLDLEDEAQVDEAIQVLVTARQFLTENGCACEEVDTATGHNENAEKLKKDIDDMLKKLMKNGGGSGDGEGNNGGSDDGDDQNQNQSQGQQNESNGSSGQSKEELEEAKRQEALEQQLNDQKQDLASGGETYQDADGHVYNYTQSNQVSGYGDAIPW